MIRAPCAVIVGLAACGVGSGSQVADPAPAKPAPAGSGAAAASAAGPVSLPPIELSCTEDRDCALADVHLTGPDTCCQGCNMSYAGQAGWVQRMRAACAARPDLTAHCLPINCPVGAERAMCKDHRCTVGF